MKAATIEGGEVLGVDGGRPGTCKIKAYNFRRPDKFSREQIQTLALFHRDFARLAAVDLAATMRLPVTLSLASVDQCTFGEFLQSIPARSILAALSLAPLKGAALLQLDEETGWLLADRLCGAPPKPTHDLADDATAVTPLGMRLVTAALTAAVVPGLGTAWQGLAPCRVELTGIFSDVTAAQVVPPLEMVILVSFNLELAGQKTVINLCVPYLVLEPVVNKLSAVAWYSRTRQGPVLKPTRLGFRVRALAEVVVAAASLDVAALARLRPGAMVPLAGLDAGRATVRVGGRTLLQLRV